ncbi:MAG: hypothetical protein RR730_03650 [Clostridium sp.]
MKKAIISSMLVMSLLLGGVSSVGVVTVEAKTTQKVKSNKKAIKKCVQDLYGVFDSNLSKIVAALEKEDYAEAIKICDKAATDLNKIKANIKAEVKKTKDKKELQVLADTQKGCDNLISYFALSKKGLNLQTEDPKIIQAIEKSATLAGEYISKVLVATKKW